MSRMKLEIKLNEKQFEEVRGILNMIFDSLNEIAKHLIGIPKPEKKKDE